MFTLGSAITLIGFDFISGFIGLGAVVISILIGLLMTTSLHLVMQWEKAVIMRLGKFNRVSGPGLVFTFPVIEFYALRVDQRISTTFFAAEETLTSDLVPVNVDAVLFWMVFSPEKAAMEVEDYSGAVSWVAQTALRKAIGRNTIAEVATRRDELDDELREEIEEKIGPWGIDIIDVEIRDIVVPKELQEEIGQEAIANRRSEARMTLAEAERDISEMLADAASVYEDNENAMELRKMHLAYESVEQSGGTVVLPSAFGDGFVDNKKAECMHE